MFIPCHTWCHPPSLPAQLWRDWCVWSSHPCPSPNTSRARLFGTHPATSSNTTASAKVSFCCVIVCSCLFLFWGGSVRLELDKSCYWPLAGKEWSWQARVVLAATNFMTTVGPKPSDSECNSARRMTHSTHCFSSMQILVRVPLQTGQTLQMTLKLQAAQAAISYRTT